MKKKSINQLGLKKNVVSNLQKLAVNGGVVPHQIPGNDIRRNTNFPGCGVSDMGPEFCPTTPIK